MSKFAIDPGHGDVNGSLGGDGGAVGYINEQNFALIVANKVIYNLKYLGHEAWNVRPSKAVSVSDSLQKRCNASINADYLVSIHFNAGGGKGSEVFAMSKAGYKLAGNVVEELSKLGFVNRGVKDGSNLYVIRNSRPVAVLIEICFVDTKSDVKLYNSLGVEKVAGAITKGLTGENLDDSRGDIKLKNLVVYGEGPDKRAAEYLADYLKAPIISKNNLTDEILNSVQNIYMIGGLTKPAKNVILISGADRYETMKAVIKYIGR